MGENRLEILMFRFNARQLLAINVFKVQEVLLMPRVNVLPQRQLLSKFQPERLINVAQDRLQGQVKTMPHRIAPVRHAA